jgi:nitrogen fixation NifU-like protein
VYKEELLDHYRKPRNSGRPDNEEDYRSEKGENESCGDSIEVFLRIEEGRIQDVKQESDSCAVATAGISMLSEDLIGMSAEDARELDEEWMVERLGGEISPMRRKCALLGLRTIQDLLNDFEV